MNFVIWVDFANILQGYFTSRGKFYDYQSGSLKSSTAGSGISLSPVGRQAIIRSSDNLLLIGPVGTNFGDIRSRVQSIFFQKM